MRGAERSCRARGNYSHLYKCFWFQGEPEQRCASGFERLGISWRLECVVTGSESTRGRVTRSGWLQRIYLRGFLGHKWWPSWRPVPANVEKLPPEPRRHHRGGHGLGVCSSTIANHCDVLPPLACRQMTTQLTKATPDDMEG